MLVDMKFTMELPNGKAAIIQPRSGCSLRGIEVFNDKGKSRYIDADVKIGLVDSNYRDNVGTILQIHDYDAAVSPSGWYIKKGSRISQMRIVDVPSVDLVLTEMLSITDRTVDSVQQDSDEQPTESAMMGFPLMWTTLPFLSENGEQNP